MAGVEKLVSSDAALADAARTTLAVQCPVSADIA
jgi:hypothetical protein